MCGVIIIYTPVLTELTIVGVLDQVGAVELPNPHSHAQVFHFKYLPNGSHKGKHVRQV
ncbi:hypothetical protein Hanom_Chr08g00732811 [Helianthus anomalus]